MKKRQQIIGYMLTTTILTISLLVSITGCITTPEDKPDWIWSFTAGQWYEVTFTQEMFNCFGSDRPEDIFSETVLLEIECNVFQQINGEWYSWSSVIDPVYITLHHITPDVSCNVICQEDFTLIIEGC